MSELPIYRFICRTPPPPKRRKVQPRVPNWLDLPEELLLKIAEELDLQDIYHMMLCCSQWKRVMEDNSFWRHLCIKIYDCGHVLKAWTWRSHYIQVTRHLKQNFKWNFWSKKDFRYFLCDDHAGYFDPDFYRQMFADGWCPLKPVIEHGIGRLNYHYLDWDTCNYGGLAESSYAVSEEYSTRVRDRLKSAARLIKEIRDRQQTLMNLYNYTIPHGDAVYWCCIEGHVDLLEKLLAFGVSANYADILNPNPPQMYSLIDTAFGHQKDKAVCLLWKYGGRFKYFSHLNAFAISMDSLDLGTLRAKDIEHCVQKVRCWKQLTSK